MKLYRWTIAEMAEQLKASKLIVERTQQKVSRSLKSLENFEETSEKLSRILGQSPRKI